MYDIRRNVTLFVTENHMLPNINRSIAHSPWFLFHPTFYVASFQFGWLVLNSNLLSFNYANGI